MTDPLMQALYDAEHRLNLLRRLIAAKASRHIASHQRLATLNALGEIRDMSCREEFKDGRISPSDLAAAQELSADLRAQLDKLWEEYPSAQPGENDNVSGLERSETGSRRTGW